MTSYDLLGIKKDRKLHAGKLPVNSRTAKPRKNRKHRTANREQLCRANRGFLGPPEDTRPLAAVGGAALQGSPPAPFSLASGLLGLAGWAAGWASGWP